MANLDTGQEILRYVLRRAGEILPTASDESSADHLLDVKIHVQQAYWEICALRPWRFNRKRVQFTSVGEITGTVTSISGSVVTLASAISDSVANRKFMLDSDAVPHRIASHTAGSNVLTLSTTYVGPSTDGSFTVFQDEIDTGITDLLAFPVLTELHWGDDIQVVPEGELARRFPRNVYGTVRAQYAAFLSPSVIRIAPWTKDARLFELSYNYRPASLSFDGSANDVPILPQDSRLAIALRALTRLYSDKRDARLDVVQKEFDETLARLSSVEISFSKPRIYIPDGARVGGY